MAGLVKSDSGKSRSSATVRKPVRRVIWDKSVLEALVSHVGPMKMEASLAMFSASLKQNVQAFRKEAADHRRVRYEIHDLASVSGFLGFTSLFEACIRFLAIKDPCSVSKNDVVPEIRVALRAVNRYLTTTSQLHRLSMD